MNETGSGIIHCRWAEVEYWRRGGLERLVELGICARLEESPPNAVDSNSVLPNRWAKRCPLAIERKGANDAEVTVYSHDGHCVEDSPAGVWAALYHLGGTERHAIFIRLLSEPQTRW